MSMDLEISLLLIFGTIACGKWLRPREIFRLLLRQRSPTEFSWTIRAISSSPQHTAIRSSNCLRLRALLKLLLGMELVASAATAGQPSALNSICALVDYLLIVQGIS